MRIPYVTTVQDVYGYTRSSGQGHLTLSWSFQGAYQLWSYDNWSEDFGTPEVWGCEELLFPLETPLAYNACNRVLGVDTSDPGEVPRTGPLRGVLLDLQGSAIRGYGEVNAFRVYRRDSFSLRKPPPWDVTLRLGNVRLANPIPVSNCLVRVLDTGQLEVRAGYPYYIVGTSKPFFSYHFFYLDSPDRLAPGAEIPEGLAPYYIWSASQKSVTDQEEERMLNEGRHPRSLEPGESFVMY